jgi:hypothetical protein
MKWMLLTFLLGLLPLMAMQAPGAGAKPSPDKPTPDKPAPDKSLPDNAVRERNAGKADAARPGGRWSIFPLAHPGARLLLGVDWRRALASPLGPVLLKQVRLGGHPLLGFLESIDNVDRILVSSEGIVEGARSRVVVGGGG